MYTHLLEQAVRELQGEEVAKEFDIQIDLAVSAFIPDEYIQNNSQKIEAYQDIANITSEEQISEICDELIDRYGEMPNEMFNLIEIARIKCYARALRIVKIIQSQHNVVITFSDNEFVGDDKVQLLLDTFRRKIFFSGDNIPVITLKLQSQNESDTLNEVLKLLKIVSA